MQVLNKVKKHTEFKKCSILKTGFKIFYSILGFKEFMNLH